MPSPSPSEPQSSTEHRAPPRADRAGSLPGRPRQEPRRRLGRARRRRRARAHRRSRRSGCSTADAALVLVPAAASARCARRPPPARPGPAERRPRRRWTPTTRRWRPRPAIWCRRRHRPADGGGDELTQRLRPHAPAGGAAGRGRPPACAAGAARPRSAAGLRPPTTSPGPTLFADFAARAAENAALFDRVEALLAQARIREAERAELSRRVVSAEQEERRRLSIVPPRRPGADAVGRQHDAERRRRGDRGRRHRRRPCACWTPPARGSGSVIGSVRELSFALEPWTLRDQGFETALRRDRRPASSPTTASGRSLDVRDAELALGRTTRCACSRSSARR